MADFFYKIKGSMDKYFEAAGIKTCEIADMARIKLEIYRLNKEKEKILKNIGKAAYSMYLKGRFNQEKISERCKEIIELDREIKQMEEEMERVGRKGRKHYKEYHGRRRDSKRNPGEDKAIEEGDKEERKSSRIIEEDEKETE